MVFGFVKKIFKGIGKAFKAIGKGIKKGFKGFGKLMNKLGIVGQIGMMFIAPHIGAFAMKGLSALGSGFMSGLSNMGTLGKFAHGVISNAANVAQTGISGVRTITDTIGGVIADSARTVGSKLTGGYIKPLQHATASTFESQSWYGKIVENVKARGTQGLDRTMKFATDAGAEFTASLPGGEKYTPRYAEITDPDARFFKTRSREVTYDSANRSLLEQKNIGIKEAAATAPEITSIGTTGQTTESLLDPKAFDVSTLPEEIRSPLYGPELDKTFTENVTGKYSVGEITPDKKMLDAITPDFGQSPNLEIGNLQISPDAPDLTTGSITPTEEGGFFKRSFAAMKPTPDDIGAQAKGQLTNLAIDLMTPKEDQTLRGVSTVPTDTDSIFAETASRGIGVDFKDQFGMGEPIAEDQIAMNNYFGIANTGQAGDAWWNQMGNTARMFKENERALGSFIGSYV